MSRLPAQDPTTATGPTRDVFDAIQKALGVVPNMTKVMANSPAVLKAYAQFSGALHGAKLSAKLREQIALLSAEENQCEYCLAAHSAIAGKLGLSGDAIESARAAQAADPRATAALTFARTVLRTRGGVSERDIASARTAGLSDGELAEIVATVVLNVFTNYFNRAFDVEIDFPRVQPLSAALTV